MWQLQKKDGSKTGNTTETIMRVKEFYEYLYQKTIVVHPLKRPLSTKVPPVLEEEEIRKQLQRMKKRTAPGHDTISTMMIRTVEDAVIPTLTKMFTEVLKSRDIPTSFADSITTLIPKKGDLTDSGKLGATWMTLAREGRVKWRSIMSTAQGI